MAALENHRPTLAKSGDIKKHYSSYNRTRLSVLSVTVTPSLFSSFILALGHARPSCTSDLLAEKWEMIAARFRGACLKFMNDFTATSPIAARHKRASRAISEREGRGGWGCERGREGRIVAHIRDYTSSQNCERIREKESRMKEWRGVVWEHRASRTPTKYINCRIFRASCISVRDVLCPLVDADLLIINYSTRPRTFSPSWTAEGILLPSIGIVGDLGFIRIPIDWIMTDSISTHKA